MATNTSNAMVPVNGKPVIAWILEDLIKKDIRDIILVLREEDTKLIDFIDRVFSERMNIIRVPLTQSGSILDSIEAGTDQAEGDAVRVILGDTLIRDSYEHEEDMIYVQEVPDSHRWCIADVGEDEVVKGYWDKEYNVPSPHRAVCGYYHFTDSKMVKKQLRERIESGDRQISDLLEKYAETRPIKAINSETWHDFGNIDNLIKAKQRLLQSRYFNSLTIDPILNTITKESDFDKKLRRELEWYESLPPELQVLTPRIITSEQVNGKLHLTQEYYGYPNLAELYLFSDLDLDNWESILRNLFSIHGKFKEYTAGENRDLARLMYWTKTIDRLEDLKGQKANWKELIEKTEGITVNGKAIHNLPFLMPWLEEASKTLIEKCDMTIIHGDYCFSNILYDINGQIVRLIDPRGSFGVAGIYGDPRYDIAKLRHCVSGHYDFIVGDLFNLSRDGNDFQYSLQYEDQYAPLEGIFDRMVEEHGYKVEEIAMIEALLFISMIPLHKDNYQRQLAMFITGITKLNQLYENSSRS